MITRVAQFGRAPFQVIGGHRFDSYLELSIIPISTQDERYKTFKTKLQKPILMKKIYYIIGAAVLFAAAVTTIVVKKKNNKNKETDAPAATEQPAPAPEEPAPAPAPETAENQPE